MLDPNDLCEPGAPSEPGSPGVTIRDVAQFRPAQPGGFMEPDGWAVIGLPANFIDEASAHTTTGTLLGRPAEVRFTPVGYRWEFSDGATVTSDDPGATWAELGQREFTATATSHVFTERGTFTVTPTTTYLAEYRFDGSAWLPVPGALEIPGEARSIQVGRIDTVLVNGTCTQNPSGPGC
ncbi:hypothetical protein [Agromyces larvae]|uniref:PKD domain-containing protein n=1 Tax=Agromyces larvae TaxID=2929802 RepID=A0ABY4BUH2_9MICO|nr:hypothetical protein [Agromyces larvae]UOE42861.1 hypothetical protein MTO99_11750 [Agromyces larvae]